MPRPKKTPSISVLIATYRPYPSIKPVFDSLDRQNFKDFEIILAASVKGLYQYIPSRLYKKTNYFFYPNNGCYRPVPIRNAALQRCRGKLVFYFHDFAFLDGNDYFDRLWHWSFQGKRAVGTHKLIHEIKNREELTEKGYPTAPVSYEVTGFYLHQDAAPREYLLRIGDKVMAYDREDGSHGGDDIATASWIAEMGCEIVGVDSLVSHKAHVRTLYPLKHDDGMYL